MSGILKTAGLIPAAAFICTALTHAEISGSAGLGADFLVNTTPSTMLIAPGPRLELSLLFDDWLQLGISLHAGSLFGYDITAGFNAGCVFNLGAWRPSAGLGLDILSGESLFRATSSADYVLVNKPEMILFLKLSPIAFRLGEYSFSTLSFSLGTDILFPFQVTFINIVLFDLAYHFDIAKDGRDE